ncbi:MAG: hypothetical protein AAF830_16220 [Pseudomonadota bacterium]
MRNIIAMSAAALLSTGAAHAATTYTNFAPFQMDAGVLTVEGFEAAVWGSGNVNGTNVQGVTYDSTENLRVISSFKRSGDNAVTSSDTSDNDNISAVFDVPVNAAGGFVSNVNVNDGDVILSAFDAGGNLLASVTAVDPGTFQFLGITSVTPIARVVFSHGLGIEGPDDFVLDEFYFGAAASNPVPVPAAALLFAPALAAFARKRRT